MNMVNLNDYDINTKYRRLIKNGFTITAKTARANAGSIILSFNGELVAEVRIKTNGRGTKKILKALPLAKEGTNLDEGLAALVVAAKLFLPSQAHAEDTL